MKSGTTQRKRGRSLGGTNREGESDIGTPVERNRGD